MIKNFLKSKVGIFILSWTAYFYATLVYYSTKWKREGYDSLKPYEESGKPFLICFWHDRGVMASFSWKYFNRVSWLSSKHFDGYLSGEALKHNGVKIIYGSTNKGGTEALREMVRVAKEGSPLAMTPDGPRGPRHEASVGAIQAARLAEIDIIPVAYSVERKKVLNSWDKFLVPFPFNKGAFVWGTPITPPGKKEAEKVEEVRQKLEKELDRVTKKADELCLSSIAS